MIVDDLGEVVWFHPFEDASATAFRAQRYRKGTLRFGANFTGQASNYRAESAPRARSPQTASRPR
jgi:hypothetical protein